MKLRLSILILYLFSQLAIAQIPQTLTYQGALTDSTGIAVTDGTYQLKLTLFNAASGGQSVWTESQQAETYRGVFSVRLGDSTPLSLPFDKPYWLEVEVDGNVLSPRSELTASAYSFNSANIADSIVTADKIADAQVVRSINGLTDNVTLSAGANVTITPQGNELVVGSNGGGATPWDSLNGNIFYQGGNVGIGTNAPTEQLELTGNLKLPQTENQGNGQTGVLLVDTSSVLHTYGTKNLFVGKGSGNFTTGGLGGNTGLGNQSLQELTSGANNTAAGDRALAGNTSGFLNTAAGALALENNASGHSNTGIGSTALRSNISGIHNTALGANALTNSETGSRNTALGRQALDGNISGSNNIAIGYNADVSSGDISNAIAIGTNAVVDASNTIRLGNTNTTLVETDGNISASAYFGDGSGLTNLPSSPWGTAGPDVYRIAGKVGIGTVNPQQTLDLVGNGRIVNGTANAGLQISQTSSSTFGPALDINLTNGNANGIDLDVGSGGSAALSVNKSGGSGRGIEALHNGPGSAIYARQWGSGPGIQITNSGRSTSESGVMLDIENINGDDPAVNILQNSVRPAIDIEHNGSDSAAVNIKANGGGGIQVDIQSGLEAALLINNPEGIGQWPLIDVNSTGRPVFWAGINSPQPTNNVAPGFVLSTNVVNVPAMRVSCSGGYAGEFILDSPGLNDVLMEFRADEGTENFRFLEATRVTGVLSDVHFRVDGDGRAYSDEGFTGSGADFAEMVEVVDGYRSTEPGDVMVISTRKDRSMEKSSSARSTSVMGIYSTKPGFIGSERQWDSPSSDKQSTTHDMKYMKENFNEVPLAVVGIVPCKVSAENGPIERGDLLVTASLPGHAMKDIDPKNGTVVGKALGSLSSGTGVIRVLVTLQ
ncbi:MAG: hypothetical protein AAFP70_00115 [Calditrichota bacterium]